MKPGLSVYKYKKIAEESLRNALRLHIDSIILFEYCSYPSSFQLSTLALEEFAKAKMVDHYYYSSITNEGLPDEQFEQKWLKLLYLHPKKQFAFIARELFNYSPNFVKFVTNRNLEFKKQQAIYVGLARSKGKIDTKSRVSVPVKKIKRKDAQQLISLINHEFIETYEAIQKYECHWGILELDQVIDPEEHQVIFCWPHKSGLKSKKWIAIHQKITS